MGDCFVEPERRLDYWISAVCEGLLEMDIASLAPASFASELQRGQLDVIGVNWCSRRSPACLSHQTRHRARPVHLYYLLCKTDRNRSATQCERTAMLRPHDLLLVDLRRPHEFHFPVTSDTISLELPMGWVERWLTAPEQHLGRVIGISLAGDRH